MICPIPDCGATLTQRLHGEMTTLIGSISPLGHNHDPNCLTRRYQCANGHVSVVSKRRRCGFPGCDWRGKATCFCHPGEKVDEWPEEEARRLASE